MKLDYSDDIMRFVRGDFLSDNMQLFEQMLTNQLVLQINTMHLHYNNTTNDYFEKLLMDDIIHRWLQCICTQYMRSVLQTMLFSYA